MRRCLLLVAVLVSACGGTDLPPLVATHPIVTAPMPGTGMSAAYMTLTNNSDRLIGITRVSSPHYGAVQLHESTIEDGVARMRAIPAIEIPAGDNVTLRRGGKHLMLMRPAGSAATVSLHFFDRDDLLLSAETRIESGPN